MKRPALFRIVCLLLALAMLSGCAGKEKAPEVTVGIASAGETTTPEAGTEPPVPEAPISEEDMAKALANIDMSILCAGYDAALRYEKLTRPERITQTQVVCTDYDGDGYPNLLLGVNSHLDFSLTPRRSIDYRTEAFHEMGGLNHTIYTDNAGNIYKFDRVEEGFDITVDGKPAWYTEICHTYSMWQNGAWEVVITYRGHNTVVYEETAEGQQVVQETDNGTATYFGKTGTRAELNAWLQEIGMTQVTSRPCEYVQNVFDPACWDSLLEALDAYLKENYSRYREMLLQDIDGDGQQEAVFLIPGFVDTWLESLLDKGSIPMNQAMNAFLWNFPEILQPTGAVVAEIEGDQLLVTAHCSMEDISLDGDVTVTCKDGRLYFNGQAVYQNGSFGDLDETQIPQELEAYMAEYGYGHFFCRRVDLSALEGQEYLCVGCRDDRWYLFVFVILRGNPVVLYTNSLQNSAMFLTEYEGVQAILSYYQTVYEQNGENVTQYSFQVSRIDESGNETVLDSAHISYSDSDLDATRIAQFFQKPGAYLLKVVVIYDHYQLTGSLWMSPENVEYGTTPEEPETVPGEMPQLGFVQIQDPSSWLHLRVGPGVEYDKVLMNPDDPDSFVRQALGSPVTVLETAEANDPANPVWVRVRITYQDRVIEGWSSKTYIRMLEGVEIS